MKPLSLSHFHQLIQNGIRFFHCEYLKVDEGHSIHCYTFFSDEVEATKYCLGKEDNYIEIYDLSTIDIEDAIEAGVAFTS